MSNAGGLIRLTCGGIGTGKSYLNVKNALDAIKSGKYQKVYSNIRGHSELSDGNILPMPDDWRDCDTDSLVIFDEIQMHEKFSKHFSSRRDGEIAQLSMIRHKRIDLWLISPNPALVNSDIRALVNDYVWLEIQNSKVTKGWCFNKVYTTVTKSIKQQAYDEFSYTIEEKIYNLYRSTEDGKASGRNATFNMKLFSFIVGMILVVLVMAGLVYYLTSSTKNNVDKLENKQSSQQQVNSVQQQQNQVVSDTVSNEQKQAEIEKAKREHFEKTLEYVKYNVNKPYDAIDYTGHYQIKDVPILAGCAIFNNKCTCYSQQMTRLDMSTKDCKRYMAGDKPFNPFIEPKSMESNSRYDSGDNVKNEPKTYSMTNTSDNAFVKDAVQ